MTNIISLSKQLITKMINANFHEHFEIILKVKYCEADKESYFHFDIGTNNPRKLPKRC
jgi:hypothetical protein